MISLLLNEVQNYTGISSQEKIDIEKEKEAIKAVIILLTFLF